MMAILLRHDYSRFNLLKETTLWCRGEKKNDLVLKIQSIETGKKDNVKIQFFSSGDIFCLYTQEDFHSFLAVKCFLFLLK